MYAFVLHSISPVAFTKGGPSKQSTAELSWALVMASTKRIVEQNRLLLDGQWRNENSLLPTLEGQRMGIIGLGHIGGRMAQFAKAFGLCHSSLGLRMVDSYCSMNSTYSLAQVWKLSFGLRI